MTKIEENFTFDSEILEVIVALLHNLFFEVWVGPSE
jgi:hypothetical protein